MTKSPPLCESNHTSNDSVAISLADMVPLLIHASQTNRIWLEDFADDIVQVSRDLYDLLVAYERLVTDRAA
jgi:hypothetical protein